MRLRSLRQLSRAVLHATSGAIVENFRGQSGNAREVLRPGLRRQLCGFSSTHGDAIFHRNPPPRHKPAPKAHPHRHRARGSNSTSVPGHTSRRGSTPISTQAFQRWDLLIGEAPWCLDRFRRGNDQHSLPCEGDPLLAETENNVPKLAQEFDIFTDASDGGSEAPKAWVCPELAALNGTIVHMHWLAKEAEGGIRD